LHDAVTVGKKEIAEMLTELLIAKGANINAKNNAGRTPLDLAKQRGNTEIVELLCKRGAKE
jgi:ankyrin repeat protein